MLIVEAGFSNKGLAKRVVDLGVVRGCVGLRYNHSSVERWLAGEVPRSPTPDLLAEVFSSRLGRPVTRADLGLAAERGSDGAALRMSAIPGEVADVVADLARDDLDRRRLLLRSGFDVTAYSSAALRWIIAPRTALTPGVGTRRIGHADVREIREAIQAFRVLDNRLGGGRIRPTVVEYLRADIVPLLSGVRSSQPVRSELFSAAAELAQLCGWQAHDLEMQGLAQRYLVQALTMARFAQDEGLGGEILAAMSQQAVYVAQPDQAIDMAQAAQVAGRRAGLLRLQTESLVMEAHGYALRADAGSCSKALRRAETVFSQADGDVPHWLDYFDEAYLAAKVGHVFRALRQGAQIEMYALQSLDMDPRYVRGRAFNVALLATGYAVQGEYEAACVHGTEAINLAAALDSARAVTYIRGLLTELAPYVAAADVQELRVYAEMTLPSLRSRAARR